MPTIFDTASYGASLTKLPAKFIAAWWIAENGWEWDSATNNPGNISYTGSGIPTSGVFTGTVEVLSNRVCVYDTWQHGVENWAKLINTPVGVKLLNIDTEQILECGDNIECVCHTVGQSNWASSHYVGVGGWEGETIYNVYHSDAVLWAEVGFGSTIVQPPQVPVASPTESGDLVHIKPGDTLSKIALDHRIPVSVLARFNDLQNPNLIIAGAVLQVPSSYTVIGGDTVSALAKRFHTSVGKIALTNSINPDRIDVGQVLFL